MSNISSSQPFLTYPFEPNDTDRSILNTLQAIEVFKSIDDQVLYPLGLTHRSVLDRLVRVAVVVTDGFVSDYHLKKAHYTKASYHFYGRDYPNLSARDQYLVRLFYAKTIDDLKSEYIDFIRVLANALFEREGSVNPELGFVAFAQRIQRIHNRVVDDFSVSGQLKDFDLYSYVLEFKYAILGSERIPAVLEKSVVQKLLEAYDAYSRMLYKLNHSVGLTSIELEKLTIFPLVKDRLGGLTSLTCRESSISSLPSELIWSNRLVKLDISELIGLPSEIGSLSNLVELKLHFSYRSFSSFDFLRKLVNLKILELSSSNIPYYPDEIFHLSQLVALTTFFRKPQVLQLGTCTLDQLKELHVEGEFLESFDMPYTQMPTLKSFTLSHTRVKRVSANLAQLKGLEYLDLRENWLECLPEEIIKMPSLLFLYLVNEKRLNKFGNGFLDVTPPEDRNNLDEACQYLNEEGKAPCRWGDFYSLREKLKKRAEDQEKLRKINKKGPVGVYYRWTLLDNKRPARQLPKGPLVSISGKYIENLASNKEVLFKGKL